MVVVANPIAQTYAEEKFMKQEDAILSCYRGKAGRVHLIDSVYGMEVVLRFSDGSEVPFGEMRFSEKELEPIGSQKEGNATTS